MHLTRFICSKNQLPEVENSGFHKLTGKDAKMMNPIPKGPHPIEELNDDMEILYCAKETDLGGLSILRIEKPEKDLRSYTKKEYIYCLEGNLDSRWRKQFCDYLYNNVSKDDGVEIWNILFGEGKHPITVEHVGLAEMGSIEALLFFENYCIRIM